MEALKIVLLVVFCLVGWVVNVVILKHEIDKQPTGAMGMEFMFLFALVPWLLPVMWGIGTLIGYFYGE